MRAVVSSQSMRVCTIPSTIRWWFSRCTGFPLLRAFLHTYIVSEIGFKPLSLWVVSYFILIRSAGQDIMIGCNHTFWGNTLILKCYKVILGTSSFLWELHNVSSLLAGMDGVKNNKITPYTRDQQTWIQKNKAKQQHWEFLSTGSSLPLHKNTQRPRTRQTTGQYDRKEPQYLDT